MRASTVTSVAGSPVDSELAQRSFDRVGRSRDEVVGDDDAAAEGWFGLVARLGGDGNDLWRRGGGAARAGGERGQRGQRGDAT